MPWDALIALIEPDYPKTSKKGGRPPYPLATMLRIHLLLQWYSLSDPAMEEALIEVPSYTSTRATPECAGGDRTKRGSGIPRCTRPGRATSGTTG